MEMASEYKWNYDLSGADGSNGSFVLTTSTQMENGYYSPTDITGTWNSETINGFSFMGELITNSAPRLFISTARVLMKVSNLA